MSGLAWVTMFLPAIAVLAVRVTRNEPLGVRRDRFPVKYLPIALLLMPGILHAVALPVRAAMDGGIEWQDWLTPGADGLYHTPGSRGWGVLTVQGLAGRILVNAVAGVAMVSLLAFFEEIGWRAWLLPRLIGRIGARRAVIATSVVWAFWHTPFQLSGITHIEGVSTLRLALSMPMGIFATGLIPGWLWLRTESIWMAAIAHGALNNWGQYAFKYIKDSTAPDAVSADVAALSAGFLALRAVGVLLLGYGVPERELRVEV